MDKGIKRVKERSRKKEGKDVKRVRVKESNLVNEKNRAQKRTGAKYVKRLEGEEGLREYES